VARWSLEPGHTEAHLRSADFLDARVSADSPEKMPDEARAGTPDAP